MPQTNYTMWSRWMSKTLWWQIVIREVQIRDLIAAAPFSTKCQYFRYVWPVWPWPQTFWPGNATGHIVPSWVVFVRHLNQITQIGTGPRSEYGKHFERLWDLDLVVRHLGIAPISRFGPRQLGIPSCRTQSRDWHATGFATWRPLREYWRSVSAQLPRQLAAFETYLMAHYDTEIFTDVQNDMELCNWEFYSREKKLQLLCLFDQSAAAHLRWNADGYVIRSWIVA